jgi:hypothetical protein
MLSVLFVLTLFFSLIIILSISVKLGHHFGIKHVKRHAQHKLEIVSVAEGAVFALLGLLIAFTFSGAYDRYEHRKLHTLEEANVFDQAYEMVDLVPQKYQSSLRQDIRKYLELHIKSYEDIPHTSLVNQDLWQAIDIQHHIWKTVTSAMRDNPNSSAEMQLVIPVMTKMFDMFHYGINMTLVHPPFIVFILLLSLAALGGFLVGYNTAENQQKHSVHTICYVLLTAFTLYLIINLEFPRVGFVQFNSFDRMLIDVRDDMQDPNGVPNAEKHEAEWGFKLAGG